jgi:hypothetical protein
MPHIPIEIVHTIVKDHLRGHCLTAKSISLVCRYWQGVGQAILFQRLKIRVLASHDTSAVVEKLNNLVSHPRLLAHVTDFDLEILGASQEPARWMIRNSSLLIDILDLIQLGQPLQVVSVSGPWTQTRFKLIVEDSPEGAELLEKLYSTMANPTVHTLDIVALPDSFLHRHLPGLKHLSMRWLFWRQVSETRASLDALEGDTASGTPPVLESLYIEGLDRMPPTTPTTGGELINYLETLQHWRILFHSLKELNMLCSFPSIWQAARKIMDQCRSSLRILTV